MPRWTLSTLDGAQSYVFVINPNEQTSPFPARGVAWDFNGAKLGWSGKREGRTGHRWTFSGVLRDQAQYDALLLWVGKRTKVRLTDDRGDSFIVRLVTFAPTQQASARSHTPWRMTYEMTALVYEVEAT